MYTYNKEREDYERQHYLQKIEIKLSSVQLLRNKLNKYKLLIKKKRNRIE